MQSTDATKHHVHNDEYTIWPNQSDEVAFLAFQKYGFVVFKGALNADYVKKLGLEVTSLHGSPNRPRPVDYPHMTSWRRKRKGWLLADDAEGVKAFTIFCKTKRDLLLSLIDDDAYFLETSVFHTLPGALGQAYNQDSPLSPFFSFLVALGRPVLSEYSSILHPGSRRATEHQKKAHVVSILIPLQSIVPPMGMTEMVPGSHKVSLNKAIDLYSLFWVWRRNMSSIFENFCLAANDGVTSFVQSRGTQVSTLIAPFEYFFRNETFMIIYPQAWMCIYHAVRSLVFPGQYCCRPPTLKYSPLQPHVDAGDVVIYSSDIIHRGPPNKSSLQRLLLSTNLGNHSHIGWKHKAGAYKYTPPSLYAKELFKE